MLALALPLIALGLILTLSSDTPVAEILARRLWWTGFISLMAGLTLCFVPLPPFIA